MGMAGWLESGCACRCLWHQGRAVHGQCTRWSQLERGLGGYVGQFWIFGGQGYDAFHSANRLNDLWRYNRATREWTWMSGSDTINAIGLYGTKGVPAAANVPGAREFMATWTDDNGDLWLFGGYGRDGYGNLGRLNDLWRYQPASNLWTWMGGSNLIDAAGVYGTLGVESATNQPGARWGAVAFQYFAVRSGCSVATASIRTACRSAT